MSVHEWRMRAKVAESETESLRGQLREVEDRLADYKALARERGVQLTELRAAFGPLPVDPPTEEPTP